MVRETSRVPGSWDPQAVLALTEGKNQLVIRTSIKDGLPLEGEGIRLAVFQGQGPAGTPQAIEMNISMLRYAVQKAVQLGAQLISFPELYLTGYALTPETAHKLAMHISSPYLARVSEFARADNIGIVCPYPEKANVAGEVRYYDSIALFAEDGTLIKNYRKTHLWGPDEKKIWSPGYVHEEEDEAFTVHEVHGFPVGVLNCYEAEFPELPRILALKGAKLVIIPTAADQSTLLSTGRWTSPQYPDVSRTLITAHAVENNIFISYCNRCREETLGGKVVGRYLGNSIIANPHGEVLIAARNEETLLVADCIPVSYGPTHPLDTVYLEDRRPELYGELTRGKETE
jgi:predicted amidohydrolase